MTLAFRAAGSLLLLRLTNSESTFGSWRMPIFFQNLLAFEKLNTAKSCASSQCLHANELIHKHDTTREWRKPERVCLIYMVSRFKYIKYIDWHSFLKVRKASSRPAWKTKANSRIISKQGGESNKEAERCEAEEQLQA